MSRFAVVGGGITGLSAAWELRTHGHDVVLFEADDRLGGKLQTSPLPGVDFPVDEGADAFLARVPDALELCAELGIDELEHPAARNAHVYAGGRLHPLPGEQLLGVPTDLEAVARSGVLTDAGIARARQDLGADAAAPTGDLSVGALVRGRLGDEVCDRLVEPLVGGINGGEADALSAEAAAPQLWACARQGGSLIQAAAAMRARSIDPAAPVFAAPAGGMGALVDRLADRLAGRIDVRLGEAPGDLTGDGRIVAGEVVDGTVLAVPAAVAARLVGSIDAEAAAELAATTYASVVLVTIVADASRLDHPLDGSGFVVARGESRSITACSWGSSKWAHWDDGDHVVLRASLGHAADPTDWASRRDDELVDTVISDLAKIMGTSPVPTGIRVRRWPESFPQYRPGHVGRVRAVRDALRAAGPIEVAGMSYDGIGVPACIRSGRTAARTLIGS